MFKQFSSRIEADISSRARAFGITLGLLCIPSAFMGGLLGGCCPLGSFVGSAPVIMLSAFAGFLAAMFVDWTPVEPADALAVGTKVGFKTSLFASLIGAGATFVVSAAVGGSLYSAAGTAQGTQEGVAAGATTAATSVALNLGVALVAVVAGCVLGILGGVIGAAIKRPAARPIQPAP